MSILKNLLLVIFLIFNSENYAIEIDDERVQKNCPLFKPCVEKCMKVKNRLIMPESMTKSSIFGRERRFFTEIVRQCEEECSYVKYCE